MGREEARIAAGGVTWRVVSEGPHGGDPVLLLHGFPEDSRSWARQLPALAGAGYRAHAADLPGIGGTTAPPSYRIDALAGLAADLAAALGGGVHLVGHDWGAIVGAAAAAASPHAFASVTLSGAPHPSAFRLALRSPRQIARSWYVLAFQLPGAAVAVGAGGAAAARWLFRVAPAVAGRERARRALAYYRTNLNPLSAARGRAGRIPVPALVVHGARDRYTEVGLMEATARWCDDLRGFVVLDSGHFVHQERPSAFNNVLLRFLALVRRDAGKGSGQS